MSRKDVSNISLHYNTQSGVSGDKKTAFKTAEGIAIKNRYSKQDITQLKHLDFAAGIAPNLRAPWQSPGPPWELMGATPGFPLKAL